VREFHLDGKGWIGLDDVAEKKRVETLTSKTNPESTLPGLEMGQSLSRKVALCLYLVPGKSAF